METLPKRNFARCYLPWLAAAAMLLFYLVTMAKTVTITGVWPLARVSGSDWHPVYVAPLTYLATLPIGWLPSGAQLFGLNFMAALCAALSLALLARCVSILPHDRTQMQRDRSADETAFLNIRLAWVPVLFAVLVCGLQRTFWENAIVGTGEALDLLLFAYCVRCLLEFRVEEKDAWLYKLAVVYGLGITNNFAMIGFAPALLIAIVWVKGWRIFRFDFLARIFLFGLAGLSLYLLLPLIQSQSDISPVHFWTALKVNLVSQKNVVLGFRQVALLPGIYALVPLLILAIRWSSTFGDESPLGGLFANIAAILLHAGLLVFCIYIAFDPPVSPREIAAKAREFQTIGFAFLPCYFLGALSIGYFSGFLLLLAGRASRRAYRRDSTPPLLRHAVATVVCAGALFVAGRLVVQNYPHIRALTSRALHNYAEALVQSLPEKASVVLSDDPIRLHAVAARLGSAAWDKHILIDTTSLSEPAYQRYLQRRYGDRLPRMEMAEGASRPSQVAMVKFLMELNLKNELAYLHPTFGYYLETFYTEPSRLVYLLRPYPRDLSEPPIPAASVLSQQAAYWNSSFSGLLQDLKSEMARVPSDAGRRRDSDPILLGTFYSRALDHWGVELQRAGRFEDAIQYFDWAIALNSNNVSALINRDLNVHWRKEHTRLPKLNKESEEKLTAYRAGLMEVLATCGPIDEPSFAMEFSGLFANVNLFRQSGHMLHRALFYAPEDFMNRTALANLDLLVQQPERALTRIGAIRAQASLLTNAPGVQVEVARVESVAHFLQRDFPRAERVLKDSLQKFPEMDASYDNLWRLYVTQADLVRSTNSLAAAELMTNALQVINGQLALQPKNPHAWFNHGNLCIYVNDYEQAIRSFSTVLQFQKDHSAALLNRAIVNLRSQKLDAARKDYLEMLKRFTTTSYQVYYGLGEIAYQQQNWREARDRYQSYLRYAAAATAEERQFVRQRLDELKKKK